MEDICTYQIQLRGLVEANDLNAASPLQLTVEWVGKASTTLTVHTDQAGLVGLIRHLHGLGFILLSMTCSAIEESCPPLVVR